MVMAANVRTSPKKARTPQYKTRVLWDAILAIAGAYDQPMTVRQIFYQCVSRGVIPKTEQAYKRIADATVQLRLSGELPYQKIADGTRTRRTVNSYDSLSEVLEETRHTFRRNLWRDQDHHVEVWCEKDALSGVLLPVCQYYQVPFVACRGFPSLSLRYESASEMIRSGKPATVLYLGDHDASGQSISDNLEAELRHHGADVTVERIALNPDQVRHWNLPTRPGKASDSRQQAFARRFGDASVELDALAPNVLTTIVEDAVVDYIDADAWRSLQMTEAVQQQSLNDYLDQWHNLEEE